jgi:hypothetical protein
VVLTLATQFAQAQCDHQQDQIGAEAEKQYSGDGLSVTTTDDGALLQCIFQRMVGHATAEGLWIGSTVDGANGVQFRVVARALGRGVDRVQSTNGIKLLPDSGRVEVAGRIVHFVRPELTEEYSVSMNGMHQDFVIAERLAGEGDLWVELAVDGAKAEQLVEGVRLVLADGGRKLKYHRLHVADVTGKELAAKLVVSAGNCLILRLNDEAAKYPIRIDPTFSDANWVSMGTLPGVDGGVTAAVTDNSGNLYIGGFFTAVGDVVANGIAKWNGSSWSAVGCWTNAMEYGVSALAMSGTNLYGASGGCIARWDGNSWLALGSGMNSSVSALAVLGSDLYAGGYFTTADGNPANYVAKWNGSSWSALGSGISGPGSPMVGVRVSALAAFGSDLYAGGDFATAGGITVNNIARWNGGGWFALGSGVDGGVYALAVSGTDLYAGGNFRTATNSGNAPITAWGVAKWNGSSWSALGSGTVGSVWALATSGTNLYAGGWFFRAGSTFANNIAKWDGNSWSSLGSGTDRDVYALAAFGGDLYAGGLNFTTAGGVAANKIAKWNGSSWSAFGSGMNSNVYAMAVSGSNLYVGGDFTTAGGNVVNRIGKWNGSSWSALGSGMNDTVRALAVSGNNLYAGGNFTTAGGNVVNRISKWNGSSWSPLGSGMNNTVRALANASSDLYAGGDFTVVTNSGGVAFPANRIARWNGSSWSALGSGMDNTVNALVVSGSDLYVGGFFARATNTGGVGVTVNSVAKWNGTGWSNLGSGMNGVVNALVVSGSTLYAGGSFTTAGGVWVVYIAQWDGSAWSALGSGMSNDGQSYVHALAVSGSDLYAGGRFYTAGGLLASHIAKWNGSSWSALGSGVSGGDANVYSLAVSGNDLYAGGGFTVAGGKVSAFAARAILADESSPLIIAIDGSLGFTNGLFGFNVAGSAGQTLVIEGSTNLANWTPLETNTLGASLWHFSDPWSGNFQQRLYRARLVP